LNNPEEENLDFNKDVELMQGEIFLTLKEYYMLPKLRKEQLYLENEMNSQLQTYMYDFLYDQQDLYEYYDQFFNTNKTNSKNKLLITSPTPKNYDLPFGSILTDFELLLGEFYDENDIIALANFRWYNNSNIINTESDSIIQKEDYEDINYEKAIKAFKINVNKDINNKNIEYHECPGNKTLFILQNLVLTITFTCKITFIYLNSLSDNEVLYLNEINVKVISI